MATKKPIKIHEVCMVSPNDPPSQFFLPLTFLDMYWLRLDPVSIVFFYLFPEPNTDFWNIVLPKLKKSLSLTLQHYIPVAGHIVWPQDSKHPIIQFNNGDGVSLTIAETQYDFRSLSGDKFRASAELWALLPDFATSETQNPVIALQITLFPNTGFTIGIVSHHGVMDGKSISLFMNSWAYLSKTEDNSILPPELVPFLDRSFVEQQPELEQTYTRGLGKLIDPENKSLAIMDMTCPPDILLGTFKLTRENINTLKKAVFANRKGKSLQDSIGHVSTFTVSCAYAMVCLTKAKKLTSEKIYLGMIANARGRLEPPIPSTYFGNCLVGCTSFGDTKDYLLEDGFVIAVENVTEGLAWLDGGLLKLVEKLKKLSEGTVNDMHIPKDIKGFGVAGSPRFEFYKADFGWGRPKKVDMISIAKTGAFSLSDDRDDNGGIEIGVVLNKHEAELFKSLFVSGLGAC